MDRERWVLDTGEWALVDLGGTETEKKARSAGGGAWQGQEISFFLILN